MDLAADLVVTLAADLVPEDLLAGLAAVFLPDDLAAVFVPVDLLAVDLAVDLVPEDLLAVDLLAVLPAADLVLLAFFLAGGLPEVFLAAIAGGSVAATAADYSQLAQMGRERLNNV
ncbi:MAG: hypothetical protein OXF99_00820 [bacterium]|nr:hypothetical protein [bacterium]